MVDAATARHLARRPIRWGSMTVAVLLGVWLDCAYGQFPQAP